jgi:CDP-diglyceride synthetase
MSNYISRSLTALLLVILCIGLYSLPVIYSSIFIAAMLLIMLATEWPRIAQRKLTLWLLTPIYPILPCIMLIALNQEPIYRPLLGLAILLASMNDTGSYIFGNLFGRHLIAPSVSPLKTWEGFFGGLISTMLVFMSILYYCGTSMKWYIFLPMSCIISALAFYGDLFESWLKRKAGIKDSGYILPGHGGILDRIDSMLFVVVFMYLLKDELIKLFA